MRVAITGAGGFLGANLVRRLLAEGHEVLAAVRPGGSRARLDGLAGELEVVEADACDRHRLSSVLSSARPEAVYHLASSGWTSAVDPFEHDRVIVGGMIALLDALANAPPRRLIVTGSAAEYGAGTELTEELGGHPDTALGAAKAIACRVASQCAPPLGIECVWLRPFTPFGAWEAPSRLVPSAILAALDGRLVSVRAPRERRDFVPVADFTEALILAGSRPLPNPAAINLGSGTATSVERMARLISERASGSGEIRFESGSGPGREALACSSGPCDRARSWLGWRPKLSLEEGIDQAIAWWKEHRGWKPSLS
jgi:nucleoside-diphosphate-sugar epimerase